MTAREYLCAKYGVDVNESFGVNYRPFSSSRLVETLNIDKVVKMIEKDIEDNKQFLQAVNKDDIDASEFTFKMWDKKIVVF